MDINLNLYKPFSDFLLKMKKKYDSRFEMMNGFSNSNLNFTDFIDNFIKSKTVAETTIDANANSTTRDVRTLLADMVKPHTKLLSYNKIFKEITKKYGSETAETWLMVNGTVNFIFIIPQLHPSLPIVMLTTLINLLKRDFSS